MNLRRKGRKKENSCLYLFLINFKTEIERKDWQTAVTVYLMQTETGASEGLRNTFCMIKSSNKALNISIYISQPLSFNSLKV